MLEKGQTLQNGRYRIEGRIAAGGMGAVYEAFDERFRNRVAVKETHFPTGDLAQAFEREARLLRHLKHEGLPSVIDYFDENGGAYLVMDYVEGHDLGAVFEARLARGEGPLPPSDVIRIGVEILSVLEYLHGQPEPILHRDIKPRNMKLLPSGRVMLLDFGLAKGSAADMSRVAGGKSIAGYTPHFAPFEQVAGRGTDARSDLYSVGATLFHLATGQMPLEASARASAALAGETDPQPRADQVRPGVPSGLADVISYAMSPNARFRPQTAREMRDRLLAVSIAPAPEPVPTGQTIIEIPLKPPDSTVIETRPSPAPARRSWLPWVAVAVLAVALGAASVAWLATREKTTDPPAVSAAVVNALSYGIERQLPDASWNPIESGDQPLPPGQEFRFRFTSQEGGYLYIVTVGTKFVTKSFLTNKPIPDSGVTTNRVEPGQVYVFPSNDRALKLTSETLKTPYTVVFSREPLTSPAFLAESAGKALTIADQQQFETFRQQVAVAGARGGAAVPVDITVPADRAGKAPVVFEIVLEAAAPQK
jgi:serine/threonine protein kinase